MNWKIRHQGSPRSIEGLKLPQVVQGLQDGLWEPTDEVMGPGDKQWVAIENHAKFAELVADLEPPPSKPQVDETRLDMNPLIDVALVLLIFFILTTSYAALQKVLQMPKVTSQDVGPPTVKPEKIDKVMIKVVLRQQGDNTVIKVENQPVERGDLPAAIRQWVHGEKTELLIDAGRNVPWEMVIAVRDAAKGAGVQRAHMLALKPARR